MPWARRHLAKPSLSETYAADTPPVPLDDVLLVDEVPLVDDVLLDDVPPPHAAVNSSRPTVTARTPGRRVMGIGVPPHGRAPRPVAPEIRRQASHQDHARHCGRAQCRARRRTSGLVKAWGAGASWEPHVTLV